MSFLRLGVQCAVIDDSNRILLSKRGDLGTWNLPGGRLDAHETLEDGAIRELQEETGLVVQIERPLGLYFLQGWQRLNVVFLAWPLGGRWVDKTDETRANQYFAATDIPDMPFPVIAYDAFADTYHQPRILTMPNAARRRMRWQLRWRWIENALRGRPEPRFPRFAIHAVAIVFNENHQRVLTLPSDSYGRVLPECVCDGRAAPWEQLAHAVHYVSGLSATFRWVGVQQFPRDNRYCLVFATTMPELLLRGTGEWSMVRNTAIRPEHLEYIQRVKTGYHRFPAWSIHSDSDAETLLTYEEQR
jgi:ADP-ribose pyrophosphatase YjhB (NUDIX family)